MNWQAIFMAALSNPFVVVAIVVTFFLFLSVVAFILMMRRDTYLEYIYNKKQQELDDIYRLTRLKLEHQERVAQIHSTRKVKEALNSFDPSIKEEDTFHPFPT
jgi:biopolymer transport protein ExbB/TolQ